jgi:hypothetical protein
MFTLASSGISASQKVAPARPLAKIEKSGARAAFRRYKCAARKGASSPKIGQGAGDQSKK